MKPCLKLILAQPDPVQETFAQRVERGLALGASQEEAKREAARMLMEDLKAEAEMVEGALRTQHPEVFAEPVRASRDQTESPEFKAWFGDSKVVDAEGKPLVVYHGTVADIEAFDTAKGSTPGSWFAADPKGASQFGDRVMPVFLSVKRPGTLADLAAARREAAQQFDPADQPREFNAAVLAALAAAGFDGVRADNFGGAGGPSVWMATRPEQIKSAIGNNGQFDPGNADIRYSTDNTREVLGRVIDAKNKTLRRVNPASVLERDIATAAKAIDMVLPQISAGKEMRAEIPVGPTPHVLHMLGAPMQTMVMHTNIIRKVMSDKHSEDFANISAREFVEGIYKPAMVLRGAKPGEWEVVTGLKNVKGQPIMVALMQDSVLPPLPGGRSVKAMSVKSAYARTLIGAGDTILSRVKAGRLAYAEMDKAQSAVGNGWAQFQASIADGLRNRSVKDDLALVKFIGDNFKPDSSPDGWADAPSFSRDDGQFGLPEFGAGSRFQRNIQDRYNRWKQTVQEVRKQGGNVNEFNDFYQAEERYWGRVGAQNEEFGKEIEDFVEAVKKDGLTLQDVAEYVYAKHAAERNAYVAKMRDDMEGTGSGMTDEEADEILVSAEQSGLEPLLMKHAATLYDWIDGTRKTLVENGLISEAEANSWEGMFANYVPLRGLEGKEPAKGGKGTGRGFSIKGKESKQITGRRSKAKQIIENIIQDRTKAYIRAGKNEVLRTFLNFALDNPSPNLWKISAVETKPTVVVDEFGNRTVEQREMLVSDPKRTVSLKDGGQTIYIEVKDQELLTQLQNGYAHELPGVLAALQWANQKVGAMLTAFNPVFVALNGVRDAQSAMFGMMDVKGYKGALDLAAAYPGAFKEALNAHFGTPSKEYREYILSGGTTGYFGLKELDETGEELAALVKNAERSPLNPIKVGKAIAKFVENVNGVVEQTTRFAAFRAARRNGSSLAESASISKNITVNFNRKGVYAGQAGAVVLFFNPAVQGTARLAQALKSPKVWGALGGASAGLFLLALANAAAGGDDEDGVAFWDKVPKEVRERNIVIMRPPVRKEDGTLEARYIKIPVAYGYNAFVVAAYEMADQVRRMGDKQRAREPGESAMRVATSVMGAVLPIQALGQSLDDSSALVMAPYSNALGPVAQALANRSGFGRPLYPESPNNKYLPDSQKYSVGQAGTVFQKTSEKLNEWTGGSKFERGLIDIAPGSLENAARFYGGGMTSMALDIMNALYVRQHIERPEPDLKRLPFAKQFYGSIDDQSDRWFAYERMNKAEASSQPLEAAAKAGDAEAVQRILASDPLSVSGKSLDRVRRQLSDLRKAELAVINDPDMTDSQRYVELMTISKTTRELLREWNKVYDDMLKQGGQE